MLFARFALLAAIAALAFVTLGALAAPAQESDRVELRIELYGFAGFHVLTNRTRAAASGDRYPIATDLDARGIASIFVDLNSPSEVRGRLIQDAARPEAFHGDVLRNGADRH